MRKSFGQGKLKYEMADKWKVDCVFFYNQQDLHLCHKRILSVPPKSVYLMHNSPESHYSNNDMNKIESNRTRWMNTRFTPEEYRIIRSRFEKSMFRKMSEYSRSVLLQKPVTITYRGRSMDDVLEELILLRHVASSITFSVSRFQFGNLTSFF